jgi:uncharacterized protein
MNLPKIAGLIATCLLLISCSTTKPANTNGPALPSFTPPLGGYHFGDSSNQLIASHYNPDGQEPYVATIPALSRFDTEIAATNQQQLELVQSYINQGNYQAATQLLSLFDPDQLDENFKNQSIYLHVRLALAVSNPKSATTWLKQLNTNKALPLDTQIQVNQLYIQALYRTNQPLSSALKRIEMTLLLMDEAYTKNNQEIWQILMQTDYSRLVYNQQFQKQAISQGWFALAIAAKDNANDYQNLLTALDNWQNQYPDHPANQLVSQSNMLDGDDWQENKPHTIAVLLPLSGNYATLGTAVQRGILDAYYQSAEQENNSNDQIIHFYDTNKASIKQVYREALANNADAIIGPLTKNNVDKLLRLSPNIPTVTLNYGSKSGNYNTYQYGLSPLDEAKQVAQLAWQRGAGKALVITPESEWGNSVNQAFTTQWQNLGGTVSDVYQYPADSKTTSDDIAKHLGIVDSNWREHLLSKTLKQKLNFNAIRRSDFDMVFLIASPEKGREIKPLLKFYYVQNTPVYATSSIYSGAQDVSKDHDLNDVYFCDIPWLLQPSSSMTQDQKKLRALWGKDYIANSKLYATGLDAYLLINQQDHLDYLSNFPIEGTTGNLYNKQQDIYRELGCAEFVNGIPKALR